MIKKHLRYSEKGMLRGDVHSAYNVAYYYEDGRGVKRNKEKAFRIYKLAASWGDAAAMGNVGKYVCEWKRRAIRLFRGQISIFLMAANRGDVEAMKVIAAAYQEGCWR